MTGLRVLRPGLFTTVQDRGRAGHRAFGVPAGGVFDAPSAALANAMLGNPRAAAVLEMTLDGGTYESVGTLALALAGAPIEASIRHVDRDETRLRTPLAFTLRVGERLELGAIRNGARTYLAVAGGWRTPLVLGSRSSEIPLRAGATLPTEGDSQTLIRHVDQSDDPFALFEHTLRVIDGPDATLLETGAIDAASPYRVSTRSNRMGLRLEGPVWRVDEDAERLSTPVAPGAVQAAGGLPLILGVAGGTMGGYPHVAHVITADLPRLAQMRPGDVLQFARISLAEARRLDETGRREWSCRLARIAVLAADRSTD